MAGRWRMKSVEQSIADTDEPGTRLRKDLTWRDLVVFGVSVVIGAGIFTVTASTTGDITGPAIWVSFLIAAATCALAALCYAEFASTLPVAGSAYTFSYATFGEFLAWVIGWNLVLELAIGAAVVAKGWSSYLGTVFGFAGATAHFRSFDFAWNLDWGALLIITLVAVLLALGTKLSSRFSAVVTTIKVAVVILVVVVGAFYVKASNYRPFIPEPEIGGSEGGGLDQSVLSMLTGAGSSHYGWYGVLAGASIVFFAFIGFDIVATMAEETKEPQRNVPRGILASLGVVTVLYVAVSIVLSGMVSYTELKTVDGHSANLATAFKANGINWASGIISIGALAGLTTVVMVLMLGQCRVLFAMSRDGLLPRWLAKTGQRGTPVRITVLVAVVIAATASVFPIDKLEEMVNVGTLFAFVLVSAGVIVLRRTRPDLERGFKAPWVPLLPIASVGACLWLMLNLTALTWVRFAVWLLLGTAIYAGYGHRHSVLGRSVAGTGSTTSTKVESKDTS